MVMRSCEQRTKAIKSMSFELGNCGRMERRKGSGEEGDDEGGVTGGEGELRSIEGEVELRPTEGEVE